MASPAGVTADTPGAPPKAPTKEKGRREAGKTAVRPRIVRSVLLAILGAGSGVSVLLGGFYDVTVWGRSCPGDGSGRLRRRLRTRPRRAG